MIIPTQANIFEFDWYSRVEREIPQHTQYSSFLLNNDKAFKFCGNKEVEKYPLQKFLLNFNNAILKKRIQVFINNNDDSYTDGKTIMVSSLNDFEQPELYYYNRLDTIIGLALHEACHCLFTNFTDVKTKNQFIHWIHNVIEDEAIENSMKNRIGGYGKFIDNVKYYYFDKNFDGNFEANNELEEFSKIFINIIRYPKFIKNVMTNEQKLKWSEIFLDIYNILKKYNCLIKVNGDDSISNTSETRLNFRAANDIYKLLKDKLNLDDDEMKEQSKNAAENESTAIGSNKTGTKPLSPSEIKKLNKKLNELEEESDSLANNGEIPDTGKDKANNVELIPAQYGKDAQMYNSLYKWAYPHLEKAKSIIYNKSFKLNYTTSKYNRSGQLDGACIVSARAGNKFVCNQVKESKKSEVGRLALVLMCDSSGSMIEYNGRPLMNAAHFITLFGEAVKQVPGCEVYVYTHADKVNKVVTDKEWIKNKTRIGEAFKSQYANGCQNELRSYKIIIDDVRKQTKLPILGINFGDTEYGCSPEEIKSCVEDLKMNSNCIMTVFNTGSNENKEENEYIYGEGNFIFMNSVIQSEVNKAIDKLANIIKREYNKHKK